MVYTNNVILAMAAVSVIVSLLTYFFVVFPKRNDIGEARTEYIMLSISLVMMMLTCVVIVVFAAVSITSAHSSAHRIAKDATEFADRSILRASEAAKADMIRKLST